MNWNFRRMLKIIEDSNAESFAKKVEMYYQSRQELIDLVYKCYGIHRSLATRHNHATGEPLINIPNLDLIPSQGRDIIISNVSSGKSSAIQPRPLLSKFPSSKQINAPVCSVSKQLKRRVSAKAAKCSYVKVLERPKEPKRPKEPERPIEPERPTCYSVKEPERPKEPGYLKYYSVKETERPKEPGYLKCYVESQSDDDDDYDDDDEFDSYDSDDDDEELQHEGTDELEAELCDMIEKLYIQMEGDRDVSKLQGKIWRHEDNACDYDGEFRKVKELVSSNVDKALLEEKLELNVHSKKGLQNLQSQQQVKISTRPAPMPAAKKIFRFSLPDDSFSSSDDSYTQSDEDDGEELQHELEAELRDMIEKLYIEMEGDRVISMLQGGILRYEDNAHDDDEEFRQVRESISSNVDKALLEENLELQGEICRLLKEMSYLEEYNERCQSLDKALSQAIEERIEAETLFASEVEQLKASIVKKNNDVEELDKILEAVEAERDQLKARLAMLEA